MLWYDEPLLLKHFRVNNNNNNKIVAAVRNARGCLHECTVRHNQASQSARVLLC
jgi:hypothetical protein